jgi:hypothetical protein
MHSVFQAGALGMRCLVRVGGAGASEGRVVGGNESARWRCASQGPSSRSHPVLDCAPLQHGVVAQAMSQTCSPPPAQQILILHDLPLEPVGVRWHRPREASHFATRLVAQMGCIMRNVAAIVCICIPALVCFS